MRYELMYSVHEPISTVHSVVVHTYRVRILFVA